MLRRFARRLLRAAGYELVGLPSRRAGAGSAELPDREFYQPVFAPWEGYGEFASVWALAEPRTLATRERVYVLWSLARQCAAVPGDFAECGVYQGGTAAVLAQILRARNAGRELHLFDTYAGMPATDSSRDWHQRGDFADTSLESVKRFVGTEPFVRYHVGMIPDTFRLFVERRFAFVHVDVDIYRSIRDCCEFLFPRLAVGGVMLFDDYGFPTCPGARQAVDEFFAGTPFVPLVLPTGQAVVFRNRE